MEQQKLSYILGDGVASVNWFSGKQFSSLYTPANYIARYKSLGKMQNICSQKIKYSSFVQAKPGNKL